MIIEARNRIVTELETLVENGTIGAVHKDTTTYDPFDQNTKIVKSPTVFVEIGQMTSELMENNSRLRTYNVSLVVVWKTEGRTRELEQKIQDVENIIDHFDNLHYDVNNHLGGVLGGGYIDGGTNLNMQYDSTKKRLMCLITLNVHIRKVHS